MAEVSVHAVASTPAAVVRATTTWREFPAQWGTMLDAVHAAVPKPAVGRNMMLYLDDAPSVEVGVLLEGNWTGPSGEVVVSALPAGRVATIVCEGYDGIDAAHRAVIAHCSANGLARTGVRWEVYGHIRPGEPATVEISWLLV